VTVARVFFAAAACASALRCAPALREPPPVTELAHAAGAEADPVAPDEALAAADAAFARRPDAAAVREAQRSYLEAARADPAAIAGLVGAIRALVWTIEHTDSAEQRAAMATTAVELAQWCGRRRPETAECEYWTAIALGVQARERPATAESGLDGMAAALERAIALDPAVDHAGPYRVRSLLRVRAPGWPLGPGDPEAGLEDAVRAVDLDPAYPPNHAALAEALAAAGRYEEARARWRDTLERSWAEMADGNPDAAEWAGEAERALGE